MDAPEAMHSTEADHVTVLGRRLFLKDGRLDNVKLANGRRHTFKKNNTETLHAFEARVNEAAAQETDAAASSGAMASVSTRDGTPSNTRPLREPGAATKGKPSWNQSPGQGSMPPPSPRKRGKQREASSTRPQPCFESDAKFHPWEFPGLGLGAAQHVGGAAPNFGLTQGYLGSASAQSQRLHAAAAAAAAAAAVPNVWKQREQPPTPLGQAAAEAITQAYESPLTGPGAAGPRSQPSRGKTRAEAAVAALALDDKLAAMKPRGHSQIDVVLTEEEKRARHAESQRRLKAKAKEMAAILDVFMRELARYEVPLVQLLLAEFALNPCNLGTAGSMRTRFIAQHNMTCHSKFADPLVGVLQLP